MPLARLTLVPPDWDNSVASSPDLEAFDTLPDADLQ